MREKATSRKFSTENFKLECQSWINKGSITKDVYEIWNYITTYWKIEKPRLDRSGVNKTKILKTLFLISPQSLMVLKTSPPLSFSNDVLFKDEKYRWQTQIKKFYLAVIVFILWRLILLDCSSFHREWLIWQTPPTPYR